MKLLIIALVFSLVKGQVLKIEGSKDEVVKISHQVATPFVKFMAELEFEKLGTVCEPNAVMIANGHKPLKGKEGEIVVM